MRAHSNDALSSVRTASFLNVLVGIWLIIAPFALVYATPHACWNEVGIGIIVLMLALWGALMTGAYPRPAI